jgi:hypothetical protein
MKVLAVVVVVVPAAGLGKVGKSCEEHGKNGQGHQQRRRASSSPHLSFSPGFCSSLARIFLLWLL